jgi:hypothetical protein
LIFLACLALTHYADPSSGGRTIDLAPGQKMVYGKDATLGLRFRFSPENGFTVER